MADREGVWAPERRQLTIGLALTISLVAVESLAIATVMPAVRDDLGGLYGWVFSAFFLGTMLGIVVAGQTVDRRGAAPVFLVGLALFGCGLLVGGLAPSMLVLVMSRAVQGFGAGAIPAVGYVCIGRSYPESLRPRMFAVLSTAWVVPGIVGPSLASVVEHTLGWRWVFLGLLPAVLAAGAFTLPAVRPVGAGASDGPRTDRTRPAVAGAVGATLMVAAMGRDSVGVGLALFVIGVAITWPAWVRLVPAGTTRIAVGLPAAIVARGSLAFAFFGADAYVPLALADVRGLDTFWIGVSLTLTTLTWTIGAWVQDRVVARVGVRRLVSLGHAVVAAGILVTGLALLDSVPVVVAFVGWAIGGFGIGISYSPIALVVLRGAEPGHEGDATASLQVTEQLAVALGIGIGGAAIALGDTRGWDPSTGIGVAWAVACAVGALGILIARRLPGPPNDAPV
jgi:MFS family permease